MCVLDVLYLEVKARLEVAPDWFQEGGRNFGFRLSSLELHTAMLSHNYVVSDHQDLDFV